MSKPLTTFILLCGTALLLATNAGAATMAWTNLNGGAFTIAANWNPNTVPGQSDTANITQRGGPYTVGLSTAVTNAVVNIGGQAGTGSADITLDLSGGGALSATSKFTLNNANNTPNTVTVKNGALNVEFAANNDFALVNTGSNNTFIFTNVNISARGIGSAHRESAFVYNGSNNRLEIKGDSKWHGDNEIKSNGGQSNRGFLAIYAHNNGVASNNQFIASGPDVKLVFTEKNTFNAMRGTFQAALADNSLVVDNEVLIENGASMVCSNVLRIAGGGTALNNTMRVTGPETRLWAHSLRGDSTDSTSGNPAAIDIANHGAGVGASNNTFRVDDRAKVFVATSPTGYWAVLVGSTRGSHSTLQIDSGALLEIDGTNASRMYIGAGSNATGHNTMIVDNASFASSNTVISVGFTSTPNNSLVIRNGGVFNNLTSTASTSFTIGGGTSYGNSVIVTNSSHFYHGGSFSINNGDTTAAPGSRGTVIVNKSTAIIGGQIYVGTSTNTRDCLLEIANGGTLTNTAVALTVGVGQAAGTKDNTLRVTGAKSVMALSSDIRISNNATAEGNRLELLDGGALRIMGSTARTITAGHAAGSKNSVLEINNGILNGPQNINVTIGNATTGLENRMEVTGAQSDIHINQLTLNANGVLEFTIGRDGVAPIFTEQARSINAAAKLKVNVKGFQGGNVLLVTNMAAQASASLKNFQLFDLPPKCVLDQQDRYISIKCPYNQTLFMIR